MGGTLCHSAPALTDGCGHLYQLRPPAQSAGRVGNVCLVFRPVLPLPYLSLLLPLESEEWCGRSHHEKQHETLEIRVISTFRLTFVIPWRLRCAHRSETCQFERA